MTFLKTALFYLAIIAASSKTVIANNAELVRLLKQQAINQCLTEHNIDQDAVRNITHYIYVPEDQEVKCWISCLLKNLGMMKDGKIDWETWKNFVKMNLNNDQDKAKVDQIQEICQKEVSAPIEDECELAYTVAVCKVKNWNELGLPKKKLDNTNLKNKY